MTALSLSQIAPGYTDRIFMAGQTGSGKSRLAAELLEEREYVVVHDGKGTTSDFRTGKLKPEWSGYRLVRTVEEAVRATRKNRSKRIIYRPRPAEMAKGDRRFLSWCYRRAGCTLWIDELTLIQQTTSPSPELMNLLTRGREREVETWNGTQRPMGIPKICFTEAEHTYSFFLKDEDDRRRVRSFSGIDEDEIYELQKFEFLYARQSARSTVGPLMLSDGIAPRDGVIPVTIPPRTRKPAADRPSLIDRLLFG